MKELTGNPSAGFLQLKAVGAAWGVKAQDSAAEAHAEFAVVGEGTIG